MHSPKMQHQKYIAPKTKQQCTKDALHNSHHRTNEAPPKMPMHSITKVHTHKTKDTMHRRCRCKEILQPKYNSPKFQRTNDSAHQRCQCIAYQKSSCSVLMYMLIFFFSLPSGPRGMFEPRCHKTSHP